MNKKTLVFDEEKYPISWRFNSEDCLLSIDDKKKIFFLDTEESENLWNITFPFDHLMKMDPSFCFVKEKNNLNFDCPQESSLFFRNKLKDISFVFFFWGRKASAIVHTDVFVKSWNDFFYPSDDTSIVLISNRKKVIFSYEETFFYADLL